MSAAKTSTISSTITTTFPRTNPTSSTPTQTSPTRMPTSSTTTSTSSTTMHTSPTTTPTSSTTTPNSPTTTPTSSTTTPTSSPTTTTSSTTTLTSSTTTPTLPTTMPTSPTTTPTSTMTSCYLCNGMPSFLCERLATPLKCDTADQQFCINKLVNNRDGSRTLDRRYATEQECRQEWWERTSDRQQCTGYDPNSFTMTYFECSFCCITPQCNKKIVPDDLYVPPRI
ncbi:uncharacterized protein LOC133174528 [Saccostrea echinata]|uniref:uncharacterized protein LOC133174528 n=1 Tax=Saccostrea echinata TaxID=191078 RepID=UPI002A7EDC62|nr:uncharacterized protein LOC133174528 [Saccostrea echinata]